MVIAFPRPTLLIHIFGHGVAWIPNAFRKAVSTHMCSPILCRIPRPEFSYEWRISGAFVTPDANSAPLDVSLRFESVLI